MIYEFYILTSNGLVNHSVESSHDFSQAPFGYVSYRAPCSCECSQEVLDDFWNCIDQVLIANKLTPSDFIRAVRAYSNGKLFGESA